MTSCVIPCEAIYLLFLQMPIKINNSIKYNQKNANKIQPTYVLNVYDPQNLNCIANTETKYF